MKMQKAVVIATILVTAAVVVGKPASAKDKSAKDVVRSYSIQVDKVYAAVIQIVSSDYNLKSAIKEGYTVNFFTAGRFSFAVTAICHESGKDQTIVTLSITKSQGNPQIFGLDGEKDKLAKSFWAELESTLNVNEKIDRNGIPQKESANNEVATQDSADVTVKSTPDGADIVVDGKFSGNTPSTLRLSAGDHKLTITSKGFQNWERTITLSPSGKITVNAALEPEAKRR